MTSSQTKSNANIVALKELLDMWALCKKYWWWFAISVVFFAGVGVLYKLRKSVEYDVEANIMVRPETSSIGNLASTLDILPGMGQSMEVDDELAIISSYSVMNRVVRDMKLNCSYVVKKNLLQAESCPDDSPLELFYDPMLPDTLSVGLLFKVKVNDKQKVSVEVKELKDKEVIKEVKDASFPVTLKTSYGTYVLNKTKFFKPGKSLKEAIMLGSYAGATEGYMKSITITVPSKRSNAIKLLYRTATPGFGCKVLNNLIDTYGQLEIARKREAYNRTLKFINDKLQVLTGELAMSESDIEQFKRQNKLTDLSADLSYSMGKMSELQRSLMNAETQLELIGMARTFLSNPENKYSLIPTMGSGGSGVSLPGVESYNSLILKRMELGNNAKGNNAMLKAMDEQLDAMRVNIMESLDRGYSNQKLVVDNLRSESSSNMSRINGVPTVERQYLNIKRQQSIQERIFMYLLQLREETELNIAKADSRSEVIDQAFVREDPVTIGFKKLMAIMLFLGIVIPLGLLYLKYKFRQRFSTREDLASIVDLPVLGEVCKDDSGKHIVVSGESASSSASELFRLIRSNLQFVLNGADEKVILVTSSSSGEGKSFISVNLAYSLAMLNKRVLLIGADIRKPRLPQYLGMQPRFGLTEYLAGDKLTASDIIVHVANQAGLDVIVAGPIPPNPSELLASAKLKALLKEVRADYDYIVIDSAPVGMVSDTFTLASSADATIYVCRAEYTPIRDLKFAEQINAEKRLPKMSIVVNGTMVRKGYGYGYGESKSHKRL